MVIQVGKKIGNTLYTFEASADNVAKAFEEASKIDRSIPTECGFCQNKDLFIFTNENEGITFVKIVCSKCKAAKKLGQNKTGGGWFFRQWSKYNKETKQEEVLGGETEASDEAPKTAAKSGEKEEDSDLPF